VPGATSSHPLAANVRRGLSDDVVDDLVDRQLRVGSRAVTRSDQRQLCTKYCLNDRLNCVEGRTQGTLDVEPLGHESR
jgi:hypothetical protein